MRSARGVSFGAAFWWLVLAGSAVAIAAGFAGGRSYGTTALQPPPPPAAPPPPPAIRAREFERMLTGTNSLAAADDDVDAYGDPLHAVAARPAGWAPAAFDLRGGRPRIAVIVVGGERSAGSVARFASEPFPLAIVVTPDGAATVADAARAGGKTVLIGCGNAAPGRIGALLRAGAAGIVCSTEDGLRAGALVASAGAGVVVDDLLHGDALFRAARASGRPVLTRDVIVDARDEAAYVDFLFAQALAIARRTGVAAVVVHARPASLDALERFAARVRRDGADLVEVASITG